MYNKIKNINRLLNITFITIGLILLLVFFYKLYLDNFIAISGDELNSILVYSSNIKTIFVKNFPGNVTFFHVFGYLKSQLFGYDLLSYRIIPFLFFLLHLFILKKTNFTKNEIILFNIILISSNFSLYTGLYIGYVFSSFIFILISYLLFFKSEDKFNKLILFLLFIQIYNHLVNLYLVLPILLTMYLTNKKLKFIKEFFIYFILPLFIFYLFSILLTGIAVNSIQSIEISFVIDYLFNNFISIISDGINRIFFYEAYINTKSFSITKLIYDIYNFDKIICAVFILSIVITLTKLKNKNSFFIILQILHILMFFIINKQPNARIFVGFLSFYLMIIFIYLKENYYFYNKIKNKNILTIFLILTLSFKVFNFNYQDLVKNSIYAKDITSKENKISLEYLKQNCSLLNDNFHELQKRNFYFNYINICKKRFILSEFIKYYRS